MKNKLQLIIILLAGYVGINAQSFQKDQIDINVGVGIGNTFINRGASKVFPGISTSFDYGVTDAISVGGYLGYASATYNYSGLEWIPPGNGNGNAYGNYYPYTDTYKYKFSIVGVRGAYHFAKFIKDEHTDLYAGIMLGADFVQYTYTTNALYPEHVAYPVQSYSGVIFSGYLGCRYRFTDNVGAFAELGYGISYLTLGLNLRF
ncbi:MAG: hypothetical protein ACXVNM_09465 [Bacteroidia bacterium]